MSLVIGSKLYRISYWGRRFSSKPRFTWNTITIQAVNESSVKIKGMKWSVRKNQIDLPYNGRDSENTWFSSKELAVKAFLELRQSDFRETHSTCRIVLEEIGKLRAMLRNQKKGLSK